MLPDRVSNPGPLTYESGALPIALRGPASTIRELKRVGRNATDQFGRKRLLHQLTAEVSVTQTVYICGSVSELY